MTDPATAFWVLTAGIATFIALMGGGVWLSVLASDRTARVTDRQRVSKPSELAGSASADRSGSKLILH